MLNTFHIVSSSYNALVGVRPLVTIFVVHPFFTISHLSFMSVGDHLPNSFLGYLFDGQEENTLPSHVEKTRVLGFHKKNVVSKEEHVGRSWTSVSSLCLLDLVKNKYWEYNCKPFKKIN